MQEKLQKILKLLQELKNQTSLTESGVVFEQIAQLFDSFQTSQLQLTEEEQVVLKEIIVCYQEIIAKGNKEKTQLSQAIARVNQSEKTAKTYLSLDELSGIELYY